MSTVEKGNHHTSLIDNNHSHQNTFSTTMVLPTIRAKAYSHQYMVRCILVGIGILLVGIRLLGTLPVVDTTTETSHTLVVTRGKNVDTSQQSFRSQVTPCDQINPKDHSSFFKSQAMEDKTLLQYFNGLCNGTYMEIGGLDGITFSNTYAYNKLMGWKGVLVELGPNNYKQLVKNRPHELATVNAGVCGEQQKLHYVERQDLAAVSGIVEFAPQAFQDQWWASIDLKDPNQVKELDCIPLTEILQTHVGDTFFFDFFSLDVEGGEYEVLKSLDFSKFGFGIIFVEANEHNHQKNKEVQEILESNGYNFLMRGIGKNDWFINRDFDGIYRHVVNVTAKAS